MFSYYDTISILMWMSLGVLCILVWENDRIKRANKRIFYLTYAFIALSALAEWTGIHITGNENLPRWVLIAVKTADYILTPMAGGALIGQMKDRNKLYNVLLYILAGNTVFQLISAFTGWMVEIDEYNWYTHGPLYSVYVAVYLTVIALVIIGFILYGKSFRRQNRVSLYAIMTVIVAGIGMQEFLGGDHRTAYLGLTLGATMMFIHYSEFSQLEMDDRLSEQFIQITTDPLTGLLSRYAYSEALSEYDKAGSLPDDLVFFLIDINGMKTVNDTLGHSAGDELIRGAAFCISSVFKKKGRTYRIGGDEFVVITEMKPDAAFAALGELENISTSWTGRKVKELSLSAGYALASEHPGFSAEELAKEADKAMYVRKTDYYRKQGIDRRKRRPSEN